MRRLSNPFFAVPAFSVFFAAFTLLAFGCGSDPSAPTDTAAITGALEPIIAQMDSAEYADQTTFAEHVLLSYRLAGKEAPTDEAFVLLQALHQDGLISRSDVLAIAARGDKNAMDWDQCRRLTQTIPSRRLVIDTSLRQSANRLMKLSIETVLPRLLRQEIVEPLTPSKTDVSAPPAPIPDRAYSTYFGQLHSHSQLSDGEGTPLDAYTYARNIGKLDFFALTDHGESLGLWPWDRKWEKLVDAADSTDDPGIFTALWGFEWSSPVLGHINVLNSDTYTSCITRFTLSSFFRWLVARPDAFGRFNHPGEYDSLGLELSRLKLVPDALDQMVGIENWNANSSFDRYYYSGSWDNDYSYMDVGNRNGWRLGALGAEDNHDLDWGTQTNSATAVLATELSREGIVEAYRARRFYVTEDRDLYLDFRCNGYPMGSEIQGLSREFEISLRDDSADEFRTVRLYRNGDLVQTQSVNSSSVHLVMKDESKGSDYYYIVVTQQDDQDGNGRNDEAISSPIWID